MAKITLDGQEYTAKSWVFEGRVEPQYQFGRVDPVRYFRQGTATIELMSSKTIPGVDFWGAFEFDGKQLTGVHVHEATTCGYSELLKNYWDITLKGTFTQKERLHMSEYVIRKSSEYGTTVTELTLGLEDGKLECTIETIKPMRDAGINGILLDSIDATILRDMITDLLEMEALDNG